MRVTTILVEHPPIAPAFAFRFDTDEGSVTISGDTCETANTVRLARDTDLLLHEAIDFEWVEELYAGRTGPLAEASRLHHYKSHTSVEGACRVAREAGARHLALHHLVPGAVDHDPWSRGADLFPGAFSVPRDLDTITSSPGPSTTTPGRGAPTSSPAPSPS
ncbi:MBL fold metallo-hydrolase, partial [Corynebacterium bovis]|uniref:MBL fold metallo-hydrolase n=1 Tax=Corynebacterium bovis TaxID=36808 RepID=UPI00313A5410